MRKLHVFCMCGTAVCATYTAIYEKDVGHASDVCVKGRECMGGGVKDRCCC